MQWGKVKNTLIVILIAINLFLLGNLCARLWQSRARAAELEDNLRVLLADAGLALGRDFHLPRDRVLPELTLDRSRTEEESVAAAMLGGDVSRTELEDGTVLFENGAGTLEWRPDGTVQGQCRTGREASGDSRAVLRLAKELLTEWGLWGDHVSLSAVEQTATLSGAVAGLPVHNRQLTLRFGDGMVELSGLWSFGTPYTTAQESGITCAAPDALLAFAAAAPEGTQVTSMAAGYRLEADSSRRLQLTPTWKISTGTDEYYLVDCAKKTLIELET